MFRIECFCDDNKLARVLMSLSGLAYNVTPTPVANAKKAGGKVRQVNGSSVEMLMKGLVKRKLKDVGASEAREICVENGYAEGGYSYALKAAEELGYLKRQPATNNKYIRYKVTARGKEIGA